MLCLSFIVYRIAEVHVKFGPASIKFRVGGKYLRGSYYIASATVLFRQPICVLPTQELRSYSRDQNYPTVGNKIKKRPMKINRLI